MVGQINHLANLQNEAVTETLLFLKNVVDRVCKPNDAITYEEEGNHPGHESI